VLVARWLRKLHVGNTRRHCPGPSRARMETPATQAKPGSSSGAERTLHFARSKALAMPASTGTGEQPVFRSRTRFRPDASAQVPVRRRARKRRHAVVRAGAELAPTLERRSEHVRADEDRVLASFGELGRELWLARAKVGLQNRGYGTEGQRFESSRARYLIPSAVRDFRRLANAQRWQRRWQQSNADGVATRADRRTGIRRQR
jgi:hypothetical protein